MSAAERAIPRSILGQCNPDVWVDNLRLGIRTPAQIKEQVVHLFAEFSVLKAEVLDWHFSLPEDKEYMLNSFCDKGIRFGSRRAIIEINEGFWPLLEKMDSVEQDSIGFWGYPPGSKADGFDESYGWLYAYMIKKDPQSGRKDIHGYAFRTEPFNEKAISGCLQFLSAFGLIEKIKDTKIETLLTNPIVFPVGKSILLPSGIRYPVENEQDLSLVIRQYVPNLFNKKTIEEGLKGKIMDRVRRRFKKEINNMFNKIWMASTGFDSFEFQARDFSDFFGEDFDQVQGGSCPTAGSDPHKVASGDNDKEDKEDLQFCKICEGMRPFRGGQCIECGYKLV